MSSQQTQLTGWYLKVRNWLQAVLNRQRQLFANFELVARQQQAAFPRAVLPVIAAHLFRPLAVWLVKSALKEAADDLGITLDDQTLSFLADLAVDSLMATA
jgi:hypothetical protein